MLFHPARLLDTLITESNNADELQAALNKPCVVSLQIKLRSTVNGLQNTVTIYHSADIPVEEAYTSYKPSLGWEKYGFRCSGSI